MLQLNTNNRWELFMEGECSQEKEWTQNIFGREAQWLKVNPVEGFLGKARLSVEKLFAALISCGCCMSNAFMIKQPEAG